MKAIYKCRLCGEIYTHETQVPTDAAVTHMAKVTTGQMITDYPFNTEKMGHCCGGDHAGSYGLADFQGWEKEDPDE